MSKKTKRKNANKLFNIIGLIIIVAVILISCSKEQMIKTMYKKEYSEYVSKYSEEYNVEEGLIYAIIKTESNFDSNAKSSKDAQGLMQLMYTTAEEVADKIDIVLTEDNILDPEININIGTKYISSLLNKYDCIEVALAAYNAGSGNVDKWIENGVIQADGSDIENIPYKETNTYVRKVMRDYNIYMQITG